MPPESISSFYEPSIKEYSGGASARNDFSKAVRTAVINKRAGGAGLITGRKAFQRPMRKGVKLLNTIQDVYLSYAVTIA